MMGVAVGPWAHFLDVYLYIYINCFLIVRTSFVLVEVEKLVKLFFVVSFYNCIRKQQKKIIKEKYNTCIKNCNIWANCKFV